MVLNMNPFAESSHVWHDMHDDVQQTILPRSTIRVLSWNIDAKRPGETEECLISRLLLLGTEIKCRLPDVVGLQEVTTSALGILLSDTVIKELYNSSKLVRYKDTRFDQVTLVRRSLRVRAVYTINLPTHQNRVALVTDIEICHKPDSALSDASGRPPHSQGRQQKVVLRLVNMHLESLHHTPCFRPNQVSTVMKYINILPFDYAPILFGDMNPVQEEIDANITGDNQLVDAWDTCQARLSVAERSPGYTWGLFEQPVIFSPGRFDRFWYRKQAGLRILSTEVLDQVPLISDHCGVLATFTIAQDR